MLEKRKGVDIVIEIGGLKTIDEAKSLFKSHWPIARKTPTTIDNVPKTRRICWT